VNENIAQAEQTRWLLNNASKLQIYAWFYRMVRNRGPWDYKQQGSAHQAFGNFNYGATGAALGLSIDEVKRAAGAAQILAGTSNPAWGHPADSPPFGDDPADQFWIEQGYRYYTETYSQGLPP
jgi:hypothetical protein